MRSRTRRCPPCRAGRARAPALAALVFAEPDFLLLDEPTNNLDREGREAVIDLLASWRGGAIVVSHDRELLDTMDAIVELTSLGATRYGGNWSEYRERKALELAATRRDLADAEKRVAEIDRRAQETAERKARKDGVAKRKRAKGDMPRILMNGLKARSEETGGRNARLAERRRAQALDDGRFRTRAHRDPAAVFRGAAADEPPGRQDRFSRSMTSAPATSRSGRSCATFPSPSPARSASPSSGRTVRARRPCSPSSPGSCSPGAGARGS